MSFGAKLRELLAERDIRQKDFAQLLHVSPSTLNSYITDSRMAGSQTDQSNCGVAGRYNGLFVGFQTRGQTGY